MNKGGEFSDIELNAVVLNIDITQADEQQQWRAGGC